MSNREPSPLFITDRHIILYKAASLKDKKYNEVLDRLLIIQDLTPLFFSLGLLFWVSAPGNLIGSS